MMSMSDELLCHKEPKPDSSFLQAKKMSALNNNIRLFINEFIVDDFKFLKCLPKVKISFDELPDPSFPKSFELHLFSTETIDVIKIKLNFDLFDSNALRFDVCDAKLEFLDLNRKILDYKYFVPDRESGCSKNFNWEINVNVSNYIEKDCLYLRFKFTLKYRELFFGGKLKKTTLSKGVMSLSDDMEKLISNSLFSDLVIRVGGENFKVHQCILLHQFDFLSELVFEVKQIPSKWQSSETTKSSDTVCLPNEDAAVFKAIILYLYCGKITMGYELNYFDLYDFAQKYHHNEFCSFFKPREIHCHTKILRSSIRFYWRVTEFTEKSLDKFVLYESPPQKTVDESIWSLVFHFLGTDSIFLSLKMVSANECSAIHNTHTYFRLFICKPDGTHHEEREFHYVFNSRKANSSLFSFPMFETFSSSTHTNDPRPIYPGYLDPDAQFLISPDLLSDDTLCVGYEIILCTQEQTFQTSIIIPENPQNFGFKSWSKNLQHILSSGDFSDMTIMVGETNFKVHKAILSTRSPVFDAMFQTKMSETLNCCVEIEDVKADIMRRFLDYIYTASVGILTVDSAIELYCTANKYQVLALEKECVEFIISNMDAQHACEVLVHSDLLSEHKMKQAAKDMICRNASLTLLTEYGQKLMMNYPELVRDILDNLSAAYCSLPSQEKDNTKSFS